MVGYQPEARGQVAIGRTSLQSRSAKAPFRRVIPQLFSIMKRIVAIAIATTFVAVCCIVAAFSCHFYYQRFRGHFESVDDRINSFDARLGQLEAHKARELRPVRYWGIISTSDRPANERVGMHVKRPDDFYEGIGAKDGPLIAPELRIRSNATTNCEYTVRFPSHREVVLADAWLSHAAPYQDLAAFEEFRAFVPYRTNVVKIIARPKAGASVQMRFDIVVLFVE